MKYFAAVALMVVGISLPACAQRGGSHGGFSGHAASASHGGFHASAPSHFSGFSGSSGSARFAGGRTFTMPRAWQRGVAANAGARAPYSGSGRYRRPYVSPYRRGYGYGLPGWGYPGYLGYPFYGDDYGDDSGTVDTGTAQAGVAEGYDAPPPPDLPPYPNQAAPSMPQATPATATQDSVTLVFADGRPSEQIHNYLLTRTTLFVLDQHHRDIPLDQLDLAATAKVNRDAGIDFHLPETPGQ